MEKTELLDRHYNAFINLPDPRNFFIGMVEYFDFADSMPEFEKVLDKLMAQCREKNEKLESLGKKLTAALDGKKRMIEAYIAKNKINAEAALKPLKEYDRWKSGEIIGLMIPSLRDLLTKAVIAIKDLPGHMRFVAELAEITEVDQGSMVSRLIPFKEDSNYWDFKEEMRQSDDHKYGALWGIAEHLSELCGIIKRGKDEYGKMLDNYEKYKTQLSWDIVNYGFLVSDWRNIEYGYLNKVCFFKIERVKPWLLRLHTHIISQIALSSAQATIAGGVDQPAKGGNNKPPEQVKIRKITLKPEDMMIEINGGNEIIALKAKKDTRGDEETKFFKIIYHLWEFREEVERKGRVIKKGDWATLDNLARGADSTTGATTKNVSRLRDIFKAKGVPIEIQSSGNGRYKLIIHFG